LERARAEFLRLGLDRITDDEEILSLDARLLKAQALEATGVERQRLAHQAAERYGDAYRIAHGSYPGINRATMMLLAGEAEDAAKQAQAVLTILPQADAGRGEAAYFRAATRAEALLLLGRERQALAALADAIALHPTGYEVHAVTLRQMELILSLQARPLNLLDPHRPPRVATFVGHLFSPTAGSADEQRMAQAIADLIAQEHIGTAFGALAAGADILVAEALVAAGADLHVVLPCPTEAFIAHSIQPFGPAWQPRFDRMMAAAKTTRHVLLGDAVPDAFTTSFAGGVSMGLAALQADALATAAVQLAVWDGQSFGMTAADVQRWRTSGRRTLVVEAPKRAAPARARPEASPTRLQAMLFADIRGFGSLPDGLVDRFLHTVWHALADAVARLDEPPRLLNSWGDGLFLVFDQVAAAAQAALALQDRFRMIDLAAAGLPDQLALRVGGHYGPVHPIEDPFTRKPTVIGSQVVIASRIEPVTAPGSIYVSEPFACALALTTDGRFRCEQVGEVQPRKSGRTLLLFSLRRPGSASPATR